MIALIGADLGTKNNHEFFDLPEGVSISHPVANTYLYFTYPFNWLLHHIPGVRNWNVIVKSIQKKFGIFGDPTMGGFLIKFFLGLAGYNWNDPYHAITNSIQLGMYLAAIMLLLSKMTSIMMEDLVPMSNVVRKKMVKRFPDHGITVGMDTALIVEDPSVIVPALLLIPVLVILAVLLPGNKVLPMGDLSSLVFYVVAMVPVFRGNIIRTWLSSIFLFGGDLYIASWMTSVANTVLQKFSVGAKSSLIYSSIDPSANPFTAVFAAVSHIGIIGFVLIAILVMLVG